MGGAEGRGAASIAVSMWTFERGRGGGGGGGGLLPLWKSAPLAATANERNDQLRQSHSC